MRREPTPAIGPGTPMSEASCVIVRHLIEDALSQASGALEGDVDATHDMRVALRKLRTALRTFDELLPNRATKRIGSAARRIARRLGVVRDADVHLAVLRPVLTGATADEADGIAHAIGRLHDERRRSLTRLAIELSQFDGAGLLKLVQDPEPGSTVTVAEYVPRLLECTLRRFLDDVERALESGDYAELHAARIGGKRLRYEIDFFAAALGPGGRAAYGIMSKLQDRLGFIADATTFDHFYDELLDGLVEQDPRRAGLIARLSENRRERAEALVQLRAFWSGEPESGSVGERLTAMLSSAIRSLAASSPSISGSAPPESSTDS